MVLKINHKFISNGLYKSIFENLHSQFMMRAQVVLLALALVSSSGNAFGVSRLNEVNPILEVLINNANKELINSHQEKIEITPLQIEGSMFKFSVKGGQLSNLASLTLRGDNQVFDLAHYQGYSTINYDVLVGLKEINLQLDYEYELFNLFSSSGTVHISTNTDTLRAKGTITSNDDWKCKAVLKRAEVIEIGNFNIQFTPSSSDTKVLKWITSTLANKIVPHVKFAINEFIADFVREEFVQSVFSVFVCKALIV